MGLPRVCLNLLPRLRFVLPFLVTFDGTHNGDNLHPSNFFPGKKRKFPKLPNCGVYCKNLLSSDHGLNWLLKMWRKVLYFLTIYFPIYWSLLSYDFKTLNYRLLNIFETVQLYGFLRSGNMEFLEYIWLHSNVGIWAWPRHLPVLFAWWIHVFVPQEPVLFSGNIAENIAYGWRPENGALKFEDILNAARQANALEFIESFPQGFDTVVGQKGQSLSGRFVFVD